MVDESIARLNIEHFSELLGTVTDEAERRRIEQLLRNEEEKLAAALLSRPPMETPEA